MSDTNKDVDVFYVSVKWYLDDERNDNLNSTKGDNTSYDGGAELIISKDDYEKFKSDSNYIFNLIKSKTHDDTMKCKIDEITKDTYERDISIYDYCQNSY